MNSSATSPLSHRTDLPVEGMTCAACASKVTRRLAAVEGVTDVRVNFAIGQAVVSHDTEIDLADFRAAVESAGYTVPVIVDHDAAERTRERDLGLRFLVAALFGTPALVLSMIPGLQFEGWEWFAAALATPVVFYSGWGFHRGALVNVMHGSTTMDTLVSMGTLSAWLWSMVVLVGGLEGHVYFETAAVIVALILLGKYFEVRARRRSGDAIRELASLAVGTATLLDGTEVPVELLDVGTRFVVHPGQTIATDGVVVTGESAVDGSMVTGEPVPVDVRVGDEVIGSTLNTTGYLEVEATRVGADTALSQIIKLVHDAQTSRATVQRLADRVSAVFVPTAIATALVSLVGWLVTGHPLSDAFTAAVAVLIIACPCALGLATPMAIMVGTGRGAQLGIIISGADVLEDVRRLDTIVLDKTGTLTVGRMELVEEIGEDGDDWLRRAVQSVEARSEHPIARAISSGLDQPMPVDLFESRPGSGVVAKVDGIEISVGRRSLFTTVPVPLDEAAEQRESAGRTVVFAGRAGTAERGFVVADRVKDSARDAVAALHQLGLETLMLTGDNRRAAETVSVEVGVDRVIAEVFPDGKAAEIRRLQAEGHRVAMVGDGINDAPALAQADLGIAMGTGTDVARQASDLTVVTGNLMAVVDAIALSRRTLSTIKTNLFWAFAYNTLAIPLAAFGVLNPMIASAAMGMSSVLVVTNSLRLRRFHGHRGAATSSIVS